MELEWVSLYSKYDGFCVECGEYVPEGDRIEWNPASSRIRHQECGKLQTEITHLKDRALRLFVAGKNNEAMKCYQEASAKELKFIMPFVDLDEKYMLNEKQLEDILDSIATSDLKNKVSQMTFEEFSQEFKNDYLSRLRSICGDDFYTYFAVHLNESAIFTEFQNKIVKDYFEEWTQGEVFVISKDTPAKNRVNFGKIIGGCQEYIFWFDKYFNDETFEYLLYGINPHTVKKIEILGSIFGKGITKNLHDLFSKFKDEMKKLDVECNMKVISSLDLNNEYHDRYIIDSSTVYAVPSVDQIRKGQSSQIIPVRQTHDQIMKQVLDGWEHQDALDILGSWDQINEKIQKFSLKAQFPGKCTSCGKQTQFPFKPDGKRPALCKECQNKKN